MIRVCSVERSEDASESHGLRAQKVFDCILALLNLNDIPLSRANARRWHKYLARKVERIKDEDQRDIVVGWLVTYGFADRGLQIHYSHHDLLLALGHLLAALPEPGGKATTATRPWYLRWVWWSHRPCR